MMHTANSSPSGSSNLAPLKGIDYQVKDGQPDILGWNVKNESGAGIGTIDDLLFDPQSNAVRYLIIDLSSSELTLEPKKVMIPIGIAQLNQAEDEVILPNLHLDQYHALPAFQDQEVSGDTEIQIRQIIGSPAALRMEETIIAYDRDTFYQHQHFDHGKFYDRQISR